MPHAPMLRVGVFLMDGWPGLLFSFFLTATNGGRIRLLKFGGLERDEGAPCAGVARGGVSYGRVTRAFVFFVDGNAD